MIYFTLLICLYQWALFLTLVRGAFLLSRPAKSVHLKEYPSLSIVVPARNEEDTIETGLRSLARLDYPNLEIIVVNDRSTDRTVSKIESIQKTHSAIKVVNIHHLPENWLGKNYALQKGAEQSRSELILFSDADVEIRSEFLEKSIGFLQKQCLDHLGGIPRVTSRSFILYPLVGIFGLGFSLFTRPWQAKDPQKDRAVGIGAFNLIRRSAYEKIGGHRNLSLRPDDDLKLALVLKRSGFKTDCINGVEGISVEWYPTVKSLVRGLEKNVMTGFEYDFRLAFVSLVVFAATFILPFGLLLFVQGQALFISILSVVALLLSFSGQLYLAKLPLWCIPFMPLATPFILFIFARACILTYLRQGIWWRDTFYSLKSLRSNKMLLPGTFKKNSF